MGEGGGGRGGLNLGLLCSAQQLRPAPPPSRLALLHLAHPAHPPIPLPTHPSRMGGKEGESKAGTSRAKAEEQRHLGKWNLAFELLRYQWPGDRQDGATKQQGAEPQRGGGGGACKRACLGVQVSVVGDRDGDCRDHEVALSTYSDDMISFPPTS